MRVPAGSLPVIAMILAMFHIPPEGLGIIHGQALRPWNQGTVLGVWSRRLRSGIRIPLHVARTGTA